MMDGESNLPVSARSEDRELVDRMIAGDEVAFETFSDDYIPALYRFALYRLNRDGELAREIVQMTVVKVIPKLPSFRGEASLMTWLCACCRREIAAYFRKSSSRPQEVEWVGEEATHEVPENGSQPEAPDTQILRREERELIHAALDQLPPSYGQALEWKYLEDLSVKEIAARMNIGAKAAESVLTRARSAFRLAYGRLLNRPELQLTRS